MILCYHIPTTWIHTLPENCLFLPPHWSRALGKTKRLTKGLLLSRTILTLGAQKLQKYYSTSPITDFTLTLWHQSSQGYKCKSCIFFSFSFVLHFKSHQDQGSRNYSGTWFKRWGKYSWCQNISLPIWWSCVNRQKDLSIKPWASQSLLKYKSTWEKPYTPSLCLNESIWMHITGQL